DAAKAGVLHKAVDTLVASHHDMCDHVDPEPRRLALADASIEQIDLVRHLRKQGIERLVEYLQPPDFGVSQVDDHPGAVRRLDPRPMQGIAQAYGPRLGIASGTLRL